MGDLKGGNDGGMGIGGTTLLRRALGSNFCINQQQNSCSDSKKSDKISYDNFNSTKHFSKQLQKEILLTLLQNREVTVNDISPYIVKQYLEDA